MKIHDFAPFPNPARVRIALHEKGAFDEVEFVPVDVPAGEQFSMADITLFAGLGFADFARIEIPSNCTNLIEWRSRVAARPSVVALGG